MAIDLKKAIDKSNDQMRPFTAILKLTHCGMGGRGNTSAPLLLHKHASILNGLAFSWLI